MEVQDITSNIRSIPIFLRQQTAVHVTLCIYFACKTLLLIVLPQFLDHKVEARSEVQPDLGVQLSQNL